MKIVIVEDDLTLSDSLTKTLELLGISVAGCANDHAAAMRLIEQITPDVVLLDIQLGNNSWDTSGMHIARDIRAQFPGIGLLVLSSHDEPANLEQLYQIAGRDFRAVGYLVKSRTNIASLAEAVSRVAAGGVVIDPDLAKCLMRRREADLANLTPHERRILHLFAAGLSNRAIADEIGCKPGTIERHFTDIARTLGLPSIDDPQRSGINLRVTAVLTYLRAIRAETREQHDPLGDQPFRTS